MITEIECPVTNRPCVVLSREATHPGKEVIKHENNSITFVNNTINADIARKVSTENPESCFAFQDVDVCGAIHSQFVKVWTPLSDNLDKLRTRLKGLE